MLEACVQLHCSTQFQTFLVNKHRSMIFGGSKKKQEAPSHAAKNTNENFLHERERDVDVCSDVFVFSQLVTTYDTACVRDEMKLPGTQELSMRASLPRVKRQYPQGKKCGRAEIKKGSRRRGCGQSPKLPCPKIAHLECPCSPQPSPSKRRPRTSTFCPFVQHRSSSCGEINQLFHSSPVALRGFHAPTPRRKLPNPDTDETPSSNAWLAKKSAAS